MTEKLLACMLSAMLLFASQAFAANPFITLPNGDFACEVEVDVHGAPVPDPAFPERRYAPILKKISITGVGKVRRDVMRWSDGMATELWSLLDSDVGLMESRDEAKTVILLRGDYQDDASPKLLRLDEASVSWISAKSIVQSVPAEGEPDHFRAQVPFRDGETVVYEVWLDPKTKAPLKFDDSNAAYTLTFSKTPPSGPLVMPPKFKEELDIWLEASQPIRHK